MIITETDLLEPLAMFFKNENFSVEGFTYETLYQSSVNGFNGGTYLVEGTVREQHGAKHWRMVLKVILKSDSIGILADDGMNGPTHPRFTDRETLVFTSGLLDKMPDGLSAPKFYALSRKSDCDWLWMEFVESITPYKFEAEDFITISRAIGRWNGTTPNSNSWSEYSWLADGVVDYFSNRFLYSCLAFLKDIPDGWLNPYIQERIPLELKNAFEGYTNSQPLLLEKTHRLPQCICHGDFYSRNLLVRNSGEEREIVALDWAFTGKGCYGTDIGQLVVASLVFMDGPPEGWRDLFDACIDAYVLGLRDSGWSGDPLLVWFGAAATAICRFGSFGILDVFSIPVQPLPWLRGSEEEVNMIISHHVRLSEFLLRDLLPVTLDMARAI